MKPENTTPHTRQSSSREIPSENCETLTLLQGPEAFAKHLQQMLTQGRRHVEILTQQLDPLLFANADVCAALSGLARAHRQAEVRILIKDPKPLFGRHHPLLALQKRLTSKVNIRRLTTPPHSEHQGYVIVDQRQLLLQHQEGEFQGFCNTDAAPEAKSLLEEFNTLWLRHAEEIVELRPLSL
ncbi:hypothetical protein G8770_06940 [Aestuariicella hydrocarbonica]|uniref:DUF7931 domain-containing protein n=1 Tax=Pseudomaricurvus hydrocarbonicus TaxID=1470433 RepID=A0A9E5JUS5_9GAMM|nr:hypothetical protein [Aestuariicella hydrocarbonica]NHO65275.1 hypothetical protein [Aestuariicella hydrocarbonica]